MALLGVVTSGMGITSLGIQIGENLMKIKDFWDDFKDVPGEIDYMLEEIQILTLLFSDVETTMRAKPDTFSRCLELCNRGLLTLQTLVGELDLKVKKSRRIGGVRAVLQQNKVQKLKARLQSAQFMLMFSHQTYLRLELPSRYLW